MSLVRPRRRLSLACALGIAGMLAHAPALASWSVAEGQAHAAGGGALLYREQHFLRSEGERPQERLVVYRCPGGPAFARKRIDYRASTQAPDFQLDDHRSGYREGMRRREGAVELFFRGRDGEREQHARLAGAPRVADAGFDEFVRAHWNALVAGKAVPLQFALPARLRTMDFSMRRAGTGRIAGEEAIVFRLRLDGLLGLVAPHIDVSYGAGSRRLLRFEGLGNLRDARGKKQLDVRIDFPAPPQPTSASRWRAAMAEPLQRCDSGQRADTSFVRTPVLAD
jgi:hypothetical protein